MLSSLPQYRNREAARVGILKVFFSTHVLLRMFIMQVLASQLPFLANRNAELTVAKHVALLSGPTVYFLYCVITENGGHAE